MEGIFDFGEKGLTKFTDLVGMGSKGLGIGRQHLNGERQMESHYGPHAKRRDSTRKMYCLISVSHVYLLRWPS